MIGLLAKRGANLARVYPADAASVNINGSTGAPPAWTQIVASTAAPFVLTGYAIVLGYTSNITQTFRNYLEIGRGAAGAESVIAQDHMMVTRTVPFFEAAMQYEFWWPVSRGIGPLLIPAGTRLAGRVYSNISTYPFTSIYLTGYDAENFDPLAGGVRAERYMRGLSTRPQSHVTYPSASAVSVTAGGGAWTYGSWTEIIPASTYAYPLLLTGARVSRDSAISAQVEIGIGAASAEVAYEKIPVPARTRLAAFAGDLSRPLYVRPNERVAVRIAANTASTAYDVTVKGVALL